MMELKVIHTQFSTMEQHNAYIKGLIPTMMKRDLNNLLKEYRMNNSTLGCYDDMIELVETEIASR